MSLKGFDMSLHSNRAGLGCERVCADQVGVGIV